jgi:outer membrane protein TolC
MTALNRPWQAASSRRHAGMGLRRRAPGVAAGALALLAASACVSPTDAVRVGPGTPPNPAVPWTPPPGQTTAQAGAAAGSPPPAVPGRPAPAIPADLQEAASHWTLSDLVDLALRNSPVTRITWARARSAAADLGSKKGIYYPTLVGDLNASRAKGSAVGGQFTYYATSYNPFVQLNWLLLDFGGRRATVDEAEQALLAADWTHDAAIQDVMLQVEQEYYRYLNAKALEQAAITTMKEAEAGLDAAERRRAAGLSTVADVLQAKTSLSQIRLVLQTVQGQIQTIHGSLATALGLPANTGFDITIPPPEIPAAPAEPEVERAIQEAQARRPDLAAARAAVEKAAAEVRVREAQDRPSINFSSNAGRIFYSDPWIHQDTYSAGVLMTIPIFNGMTYQYNVYKAKADRDEATARLDTLAQEVTLQVWTSYFNHKTAAGKVETARDLLESAQQSYDVVSARYKAGVGSILDLLTAEEALGQARAQDTQARTEWFLTMAQLAHDTGTLWQSTSETAPREDNVP